MSFDDHFYSAPYTLVGEILWCRATGRTIELIHQGKRITSHVRSYVKYDYSTHPEHRPASHRAHLKWTPSRLIDWGRSIGVHTAAVIEHVIRNKPHPEQGYRSALGILRLSRTCGNDRLELACARALDIHSAHYRTLKTMLKQRMEGVKPMNRPRSRARPSAPRTCAGLVITIEPPPIMKTGNSPKEVTHDVTSALSISIIKRNIKS